MRMIIARWAQGAQFLTNDAQARRRGDNSRQKVQDVRLDSSAPPTNINDRIQHLADRLELETENLAGKTHPNEKDRGLDVVAQLRFGDGGTGSVILLTQCAVGNAWKGKIGEPSLNHWRDIYKWNAQLLRTIAVPWRLSSEFDVTRTHRLFNAIVLDRPRLAAGKPDRFLDPSARKDILKWCEGRFSKIPELKSAA